MSIFDYSLTILELCKNVVFPFMSYENRGAIFAQTNMLKIPSNFLIGYLIKWQSFESIWILKNQE